MIKDYRLLFILTVVTLAIVMYSVAGNFVPEYAAFQKQYYQLNGVKDFQIEIQQLNVDTGSGVLIDRCTTCHLGSKNKGAANFPQPLKTHPPVAAGATTEAHDFNKMGCVVCHDGNGRGLEKKDAHGEFHDWPAPLIAGKNAQSSCGKCHAAGGNDIPGAPAYNLGRKLFVERACWACHTIDGISAGKSAPDLTDAGGKFSLAYLKESIVEPTANTPISKMPKFAWVHDKDQKDVEALAIFLKGQRKNRLRDAKKAPVGYSSSQLIYATVDTPTAQLGRKIFFGEPINNLPTKGGCINCHSFREDDGTLRGGLSAPDLTYDMRARGKQYIVEHLKNPKNDTPDTNMPSFALLSGPEIESLTLFLGSLKYSMKGGAQELTGKKLFMSYCASCHGENLNGRGPVSIMLDPLPRDFSRYQFVATYRERFKQSIQNGVIGTAMPPWKAVLSDAEVERIIDFIDQETVGQKVRIRRPAPPLPVIGATDRRNPERLLVKGDVERGNVTFQKFCTSCHGKLANGKGPNAYYLVHPLPRNLLNKNFFTQAYLTDNRIYDSILLGVPGTSMPSHDHFTDQTLLDLVAFIRNLQHTGKQ
ncbi:MAG: hypothetical protein A2X86_00330 [Bdellovibrionales bacterium GWA2_49_15]|nr:MAG: hypothetical protein A2X86_00330 [Bdellovibrionales bacterium GWA2_49_15]HAZ14489.1 hypothetical protein [Bdellovibrionales bacterium]